MLPLVKLGSLAFRTVSKPIAAHLKLRAGLHPKFRDFIIGIAQVIGAPPAPGSSSSLIVFVLQSARRCWDWFPFFRGEVPSRGYCCIWNLESWGCLVVFSSVRVG
jgi:hypothetical protein